MAVRFAASLTLAAMCQAERAAPVGVEPLISTELLQKTSAFFFDAGSAAWKSAGVDKLVVQAQVPVEDFRKQTLEPLLRQATQASDQYAKQYLGKTVDALMADAQVARVQAQAAISQGFDQIYQPLDKVAVDGVSKLEKAFPAYKGLVGKSLGNVVIFALYLSFVLYVALKITLFFVRLAWAIFTCLCCTILCCGCCRGGKADNTKKGKANGKAAAKANGKAAAKSAPSAPAAKAATSNGKKK